MTTLRKWDRTTIDLTVMTGTNLPSIRATNAHHARRTRPHRVKRVVRAVAAVIRHRKV